MNAKFLSLVLFLGACGSNSLPISGDSGSGDITCKNLSQSNCEKTKGCYVDLGCPTTCDGAEPFLACVSSPPPSPICPLTDCAPVACSTFDDVATCQVDSRCSAATCPACDANGTPSFAGCYDKSKPIPSVPSIACAPCPQPKDICGGLAGILCDAGKKCVDDTSDGCDPNNGGADCPGICVPDGK